MAVKIYTTDSCPQCRIVKSYLQAMNVEFEEVKVNTPELIEEVVNLSGQRSIPVIQAGEEIIVGFQPDKLKNISC